MSDSLHMAATKRIADISSDDTSVPKRVCLGEEKITEHIELGLTSASTQELDNRSLGSDAPIEPEQNSFTEATTVKLTDTITARDDGRSDTPSANECSTPKVFRNDRPTESTSPKAEPFEVSLPKPVPYSLPEFMKKHFTTVKERIEEVVDDGFSSIEEQIGTALISNHVANSDLRVARVLVHSLREEIRALEAQNENLRNELQRCEERLYQHGRETEEWVDRMKEMLRRIPGHSDA